jgi:hypothetical protein
LYIQCIIKKDKKMKQIKLFRIVKQSMYFCEEDFETVEEYDKFVDELKSNEDFLLDTFYDNFDGENEKIISDVKTKEYFN